MRAGRPRREDYDEQEASVHVGVWALSAVAGLMTAIDGGGLLALLPSIMWRFPCRRSKFERGTTRPRDNERRSEIHHAY